MRDVLESGEQAPRATIAGEDRYARVPREGQPV
jgi:hypothetical protein